MSNWIQQIEQHVAPDTFKVGMYHGPDRYDLLSAASDFDVLIASYGTLSTDYGNEFPKVGGKENSKPKKKKARTKGPSIFAQIFLRVILDEAHIIRNTKSRTFAGCSKLQATYRLCLTGTPLQNKPEDIRSLFAFLSVEPLGDRNIFRRAISQPIQNGDDVGIARLRTMMAHIALRRNKSKLDLVEKTVELRSIAFPADSAHKGIHDALFESAQIAFRATLSAGDDKALKNYMMILETLTRIRQACVSGCLVPKERLEAAEKVLAMVTGKKGELTAEEGEALLQKLKGALADEEGVECAICLEDLEESATVILRSCKHVFCEPCITKVEKQCRGLCPLCRQQFQPDDIIKKCAAESAAATDDGDTRKSLSDSMDDLGPSPKLEAMGQAITEMKVDEKGVIFSQFTKFLDIIEPFLTALGHTFVRIDGSKTAKQRIAAMDAFSAEDGPRFILCSLHAAGTGITLNRANHAFMCDTWWNVSVENQAMDRVSNVEVMALASDEKKHCESGLTLYTASFSQIHRIGQTRNVRVVRFVMKDSIEERMIALQEAKAAIGKGAMEKLKPDEIRKARIGDLKNLFSIVEELV
jgi:SNF2 family DNA or RNA helicase